MKRFNWRLPRVRLPRKNQKRHSRIKLLWNYLERFNQSPVYPATSERR